MGLINFVKSALHSKDSQFAKAMTGTSFSVDMLPAQIYYKELVIQTCISIVANALVMSEFQTYVKGKEQRQHIHYLLNVQPNKNQNATEFWNEVVTRLIYDNECLIVPIRDEWFIAEEFNVTKYVHYEDRYTDIRVRELDLKQSYVEGEVLYFKLNDMSIKKLIDGLYADYSQLLSAASKSYKKANGFKAILKIDGLMPQTESASADLEDLLNVQFKNFIEKDNAVLPIAEGMNVVESSGKGTSKDTRDIRKLVDDVIEFVCMAMRIPVGLVRGDVAGISEQTDNFLMLCINPYAKLITTEINRKWYYEDEYLTKTYVKMDTQKIRLVDLEKISKAADMLFRIGVHNIDDNRELVGKERLETDWSREHYVTKNYNSVLSQTSPAKSNTLKGGESNGKTNS